MNNRVSIIAIAEGATEVGFIKKILAPYLSGRHISIEATQIGSIGKKGGDVRFERLKPQIEIFLKQQNNTYITTFVDYYGLKKWPELDKISPNFTPEQIACHLQESAQKNITQNYRSTERFIPYIAIHEFEALLFSDSKILSEELGIKKEEIDTILKKCGSPEKVNNSKQTAPSKRIATLAPHFGKLTKGIVIAEKIGIDKMREQCPVFNTWITTLENLKPL